MATSEENERTLEIIGEVAEILHDATLRCQDLLDEVEEEHGGRWSPYLGFREAGAAFRSAAEQLQAIVAEGPITEVIAAFHAGARAGLEASADLAQGLREVRADSVELGVERLALASQHFVRGRFLLQRYLDQAGGGA